MEQDPNMEVASTLPECEKEVGISAGQEDGNEEDSAKNGDNRIEAVSSAEQEETKIKEVCTEEQVDDIKEAKAAAAQAVGSTQEAGTSAEKCSEVGSSGKKKKVLVKRKIVKKSHAGSVLKTKKAQGKQEDDEKKEKEVPAAPEVTGTSQAENSTENFSKSESSSKKNCKVLKVKKKIVKKSAASSPLMTKKVQASRKVQASPKLQARPKVQASPKVQTRKRQTNNKSLLQENGESGEKKVEDVEKLNKKEKSISEVEHNEKSEEIHLGEKEISELKGTLQVEKDTEKAGHSDKSIKNQKSKDRSDESIKKQRNKNNDNVDKVERKDKNEEKLGGLIFMCSSKTKPDCFHYKVMGVSAVKKDLVLAITPGLKLFLYDFDLKLLYGIYKASSSGGMKLEPNAFNGAFPAQVRFSVYKDCFPLPESVFKKAIQDNYYEKRKFKTELTEKQVRKLSVLFRPVGFHSSAAPVQPPPRTPIPDRKVHGGVEEVRSRAPKSKGDTRRVSSHERDRKVARREEAPRHREETSRDLYLSEKDYRTYGLQAERRNLDPVPRATALETHHRDYDDLRHPERRLMDVVSAQREIVRADHVYFNGKDYPVYSIDSRPELSPPRTISATASERYTYGRYGRLPMDTHLLPSRREEGAPLTYSTRSYAVDTEPVRHAADALSHYNQIHLKKSDSETMPVSSRYSFAGPSYTYR